MRKELNKLPVNAKIAIGEGERDKAPMLYIGEKLGKGGEDIDIAVDPLEGTTICAKAGFGAMSVIAVSSKNSFLCAPDLYMEKIAIGKGFLGIEAFASGKRFLVIASFVLPKFAFVIARIQGHL